MILHCFGELTDRPSDLCFLSICSFVPADLTENHRSLRLLLSAYCSACDRSHDKSKETWPGSKEYTHFLTRLSNRFPQEAPQPLLTWQTSSNHWTTQSAACCCSARSSGTSCLWKQQSRSWSDKNEAFLGRKAKRQQGQRTWCVCCLT